MNRTVKRLDSAVNGQILVTSVIYSNLLCIWRVLLSFNIDVCHKKLPREAARTPGGEGGRYPA
ncbi:hypothetical protein EBL_c02530 [Shimwellia blattae DSM 4481 = NBRC 105725]|uniref:Uncharacterized protein n=1 Tax=Shimwellia blattae (strain ATCC 29907 / DSM 4481 / JCM 1650 / NBRC 105725 / CDC 9005-74) TaxID=630626 RepID=I2B4D4_SHIBC|nr:hypothetical protein EBL_c02530 [Shimwellia blattae DSM 4481 = NBRC 105725]